jgi:8-oxo-dGTP diphosphatase
LQKDDSRIIQSAVEAVGEEPPKRKAREPVPVTAALIENDGHILIGKRKRGHFAGRWEFPGGKVEEGEAPEDCLRRELHEELGVEARVGELFLSTIYAYHHVTIELLTYRAEILSGEIVLRDHTEIRWVPIPDLRRYDFPEADKAVIEKLTKEAAPGMMVP